MQGEVKISIEDYDSLKKDSEGLRKLAKDTNSYARFYSTWSYDICIKVDVMDDNEFLKEAYEINKDLNSTILELKKELSIIKDTPKKKWWQIWLL